MLCNFYWCVLIRKYEICVMLCEETFAGLEGLLPLEDVINSITNTHCA